MSDKISEFLLSYITSGLSYFQFVRVFFSVFLFITLSSVSLQEKVKYADDFCEVWGVFGSLRSFVPIVYHVK